MLVEIDWTEIEDDNDPLWQASRCLYVYADPNTSELLYVGKADWQTVRQRLYGEHKNRLFDYLGMDGIVVFHGEVLLEAGRRLTSELLGDAEAFLIMELQPPGNVANIRSRVGRRGLCVSCVGQWEWEPDLIAEE